MPTLWGARVRQFVTRSMPMASRERSARRGPLRANCSRIAKSQAKWVGIHISLSNRHRFYDLRIRIPVRMTQDWSDEARSHERRSERKNCRSDSYSSREFTIKLSYMQAKSFTMWSSISHVLDAVFGRILLKSGMRRNPGVDEGITSQIMEAYGASFKK